MCSGESRYTVARVASDSILAGSTVCTRVVNTVVDVWEYITKE